MIALAGTLLVAGCSAAPGASSETSSAPSASPSVAGSPAPTAASSGTAASGVRGKATAGPVCPVERVPPDSACAPRPVIGATIVILDPSGKEVARATTGSDGTYHVTLPPGTYTVNPEKTTGIMRAPAPQPVTVVNGVVVLDLSYDTGIR